MGTHSRGQRDHPAARRRGHRASRDAGIFKHASKDVLFGLLKGPGVAAKFTLEALHVAPRPVLKHFAREWLRACLPKASVREGRLRAPSERAEPMRILDLSAPITSPEGSAAATREVPIRGGGMAYTGVVHDFAYYSEAGTYLDLPSHIRETDDGTDAAGYPVERLYRVDAEVVRLDRVSGSGEITAADLQGACPPGPVGGALVLNALGRREWHAIRERSVWLGRDAVEWIAATGAHLLVSDVYEKHDLSVGVFLSLFRAGVAAVCHPAGLWRIEQPRVRVTALAPPVPGATQIPCRLLVEEE